MTYNTPVFRHDLLVSQGSLPGPPAAASLSASDFRCSVGSRQWVPESHLHLHTAFNTPVHTFIYTQRSTHLFTPSFTHSIQHTCSHLHFHTAFNTPVHTFIYTQRSTHLFTPSFTHSIQHTCSHHLHFHTAFASSFKHSTQCTSIKMDSFTVRRYARVVYAVVVVCSSICQTPVL